MSIEFSSAEVSGDPVAGQVPVLIKLSAPPEPRWWGCFLATPWRALVIREGDSGLRVHVKPEEVEAVISEIRGRIQKASDDDDRFAQAVAENARHVEELRVQGARLMEEYKDAQRRAAAEVAEKLRRLAGRA